MRKPTVRSPTSSSMASTSSISASESDWRSSVNDWPSEIVPASISRMSASRSRISSKTCWRSIGPCSRWVWAGIAAECNDRVNGIGGAPKPLEGDKLPESAPGHRRSEVGDQVAVDHVLGDAAGVDDGPGARRPMADDAHAVDAEEHAAAVGLGVELLGQGREGGPDDVEALAQVVGGGEPLDDGALHEPHE